MQWRQLTAASGLLDLRANCYLVSVVYRQLSGSYIVVYRQLSISYILVYRQLSVSYIVMN